MTRLAPWERKPSATDTPASPESPATASTSTGQRGLLAATGSMAVATLTSRITGFLKTMLLLTMLGKAIAGAYSSAALLPNMISEVVLGAVLTAIVIPVLVRAEREDADHGAAFIRRMVAAAIVMLGSAAVLATAAAPLLVNLMVEPDGETSTPLTIALSYLLLPAILFYGMTALLTAILNTRGIFKPGTWAPVLNNMIVITVLVLYRVTPGEISLDPVRMGDPKLLLLGVGVTAGVIAQVVVLLPAIRRAGVDIRPLWGIDNRLKQFGGMAAAIILYVVISQAGLIYANRIASTVEGGPAIYQNAWLFLQMPYGVLGVAMLTAIMPRLSRHAAADNNPAVVDDLSIATRLTMIAFIPIVVFLTFVGPQIGEALFGFGKVGLAGGAQVGEAISWSAFTLIPYALVLIHLRVFYAREQAWTPTWIVVGITTAKIALSALAPVLANTKNDVINLLGTANGLAYLAGAMISGYLLHRSLGELRMANIGRTAWRVMLASLAGAVSLVIVDRGLRLYNLTTAFANLGSLLRVAILGLVMLVVTLAVLRIAGVPEIAALTLAVSRRLGRARPAPEPELPGEEPTVDERHYYQRPYDPFMDAETMILPAIRPGALAGPPPGATPAPQRLSHAGASPALAVQGNVSPSPHRAAQVPYPVAQSNTGVPANPARRPQLAYRPDLTREGVVVSDNAISAASGTPPAEAAPSGTPAAAQQRAAAPAASGQPVPPASGQPAGDGPKPPPPGMDQPTVKVPGAQRAPGVPDDDPNRQNSRGPQLIPGASVAGGRYRLLAAHGGARGLRFWQATDIKLDREVALTFVDAEQQSGTMTGPDSPQAILSRTLRLGRVNSAGLARVLDVVRGSSGGIVVAEWTPGRSLREMAETAPSPIGAARAIRALAAAAETAHRGGGALSIDHPDRVRISVAGDAVLAFPGTLADADAQSDVRGLGAMLYALMTARWPIGNPPGGVTGTAVTPATVGGLRLADHGADGAPVEPRALRPEVPFEISAVAVRALETNRGVRTAATVQHVLEQASVLDQKTDFIPTLRVGQRATAPPTPQEREAKSNQMMIVLIVLAVLAAIVSIGGGMWVYSTFLADGPDKPFNDQNLGLTPVSSTPAAPGSTPGGAVGGAPVPLTEAVVFSPQGTADNPGGAKLVLDNNPATMWKTDAYRQQFPQFKPGIGVVATVGSPAQLNKVSINSPSADTRVEIRSAASARPTLDQTQVIGSGTLGKGVTEIAVKSDQPVRYVLVWITQLGKEGGQFQTAIADISAA